ncbi:MAG: peptide chain release factor N(5)-glutamine methyltransferase [Elusimicrobia bacterium]|nr:peptide chain release factor N(5)-glutamine methyltransferase [Elusimicrobiota bacterium]
MTVAAWLEKARAFLEEREVPEASASAEFLLAETLDLGRGGVLAQPARELGVREGRCFWNWVKARGRRRPLAYILGRQPFLDLNLEVTPDVLIPRPETEELVLEGERLVRSLGAAPPRILEIGTGSGCIAIALARRIAQAAVFATDVSVKALALAERNAVAHHVVGRVRFVREDLFAVRSDPRPWADLLISNPPYVPSDAIGGLEAEVLQEPRLALDGGRDGLDAIRALAAQAPRRLRPGGWIALEIGADQGSAAAELLRRAGLEAVQVRKDAQGLERIAVAKVPAAGF